MIPPKVKHLLQQLTSAIDASGALGPGMPPPVALPWWRSPGAAYVPGETAADNPTRAKQLAAQNLRVNGDHGSVADSDFPIVLAMADKLGADDTTAAGAEDLVEFAKECDKDSTVYQVILGQVNSSGMGRPSLMFPHTRLADVIHAVGTAGKPSGF